MSNLYEIVYNKFDDEYLIVGQDRILRGSLKCVLCKFKVGSLAEEFVVEHNNKINEG